MMTNSFFFSKKKVNKRGEMSVRGKS